MVNKNLIFGSILIFFVGSGFMVESPNYKNAYLINLNNGTGRITLPEKEYRQLPNESFLQLSWQENKWTSNILNTEQTGSEYTLTLDNINSSIPLINVTILGEKNNVWSAIFR